MEKFFLLSAVVLLVFPTLLFADYVPDDTEYFEGHDCEDICAAAEFCRSKCFDGDCESFCAGPTIANSTCLDAENCTELEKCLCEAKVDDDDDGGGCDVSHSDAGSALTFLMLAVGLLALWIGARKTKGKSS